MDHFRFPPPNQTIFTGPPQVSYYQTRTNVPSPAPPIPDPIESIISGWESEIAPSFHEKRKLLHFKRRMSLVNIKTKLSRWKTLLRHSEYQYFVGELDSLKRECTDQELLQIMKRKIERRNRRKRSWCDTPTVLRIGVGDVLSRPDFSELPVIPGCQPSQSSIRVKSEDKMISAKYLEDLKKASKFCQEKLEILKKLSQLRIARISQFRGQGRLIPIEIDNIFESKKASILNDLESTQMTINKLTMRIKNNYSKSTNQSTGLSIDSGKDDFVSNGLPFSVRFALFGSVGNEKNAKWSAFYHQFNRNFSDFIRFRSNWDKYSVPENSMEASYDRHRPSKLPITWELPPSPSKK